MTRNPLLPILAALILALAFSTFSGCQKDKDKDLLLTELTKAYDTATVYQNKAGQYAATNHSLQLTNEELLAIDSRQDVLLKDLQQAVKDAGKSARAGLSFSATREGKASGSTVRTVYVDRVVVVSAEDTATQKAPVYYGTATSDGFSADVEAGPDTIHVRSYKVQQSFTATFSSEKTGFLGLGRKKQRVDVTATTPGGKVLDVRAFEVPPTRGPGFMAGFGVGTVAGFIGRGFVPGSN